VQSAAITVMHSATCQMLVKSAALLRLWWQPRSLQPGPYLPGDTTSMAAVWVGCAHHVEKAAVPVYVLHKLERALLDHQEEHMHVQGLAHHFGLGKAS
jgi:hypothetical protein